MTIDDAVKIVRELGFPIAVAAYVLWRLDGRLRDLTEAINRFIQRQEDLMRPEAPRAKS